MTVSGYLLDSNFLIYALPFQEVVIDEYSSQENIDLERLQKVAKKRLFEFINSGTVLMVTPVIQYELFCDAKSEAERLKLKADFNDLGCRIIQVNEDIAELAAEIFRAERDNQAPDKKKHKFDILHIATAKHERLGLVTYDKKLRNLVDRYLVVQE